MRNQGTGRVWLGSIRKQGRAGGRGRTSASRRAKSAGRSVQSQTHCRLCTRLANASGKSGRSASARRYAATATSCVAPGRAGLCVSSGYVLSTLEHIS